MNTIQLNQSKKKKQVFSLQTNISAMINKHGLNKIGFLTLTFADNVQCHKEATKRFNSLATNVLKNKYLSWIRISERQQSGRWHFHLIVACHHDIRRGLRFDELKNRDYSSANSFLRGEWRYWRSIAKKYNFGRTELLPVRTDSQRLAAYLAKYLNKSIRTSADKGARLVSYSSKVLRVCTQSFSWFKGGQSWRKACELFFTLYKVPQDRYWAYKYGDIIKQIAEMLNEKQQQQQPPQPPQTPQTPQTPQPQTMCDKPKISFAFVVQIAKAITKIMYS